MIQLVQRPWGGTRVFHYRKKARVARESDQGKDREHKMKTEQRSGKQRQIVWPCQT